MSTDGPARRRNTTTYQARTPSIVAEYFAAHPVIQTAGPVPNPTIVEEFIPGRGWRRAAWNKRISRTWCRKLAREGVTFITVTVPGTGVRADFAIQEVTR